MKKNIFMIHIFLIFVAILSGRCSEIIKNGKAVIQGIVIPDDKYYSSVNDAAKELSYHLKKSTGIDIPVIKEKLSKADGKYIYLGSCRKSLATGIVPSSYVRDAGVIFVGKNNVYILGNDGVGKRNSMTSLGTLFSTYAFLEKHLGVKWLWPGTLGEVIPLHKNIVLQECKENITPKLISSRWRSTGLGKNGWSSKKNRDKYFKETLIWLDRHRFSFHPKYNFPHAFTKYFKKFGKSNPEFFNLLPDGTRRSNPYDWSGGGADKYISMCVTSSKLTKQIVSDWQAKSPRSSIINLNENDTTGDCVCENCLTADSSTVSNKIRRKKATEKFLAKKKEWVKELGSVSDRYCKFYLKVQEAADEIDPKYSIAGLIYANYSEPPSKKIKLNDRIILRFCPPFMFPWTDKKIADYKRIWGGWAKTGAQLMFRPNFTIIQCFPIMYQDVFYDLFNFSYDNGMSITDMDSLTGHYGVQGPVNYVIASLNHDKNSSLQTLENNYFSAFGAAKKLVKQYFDLMKKVSMSHKFNSYTETIEGGSTFFNFFLHADSLFTPKVMDQANKILTKAVNVPGLDSKSRERVEFLRIALKHSQMLMDTQVAFRKYKASGVIKEFKEKLYKLYRFRASIEDIGAVNVGTCYRWESIFWPKLLLKKVLKDPYAISTVATSPDIKIIAAEKCIQKNQQVNLLKNSDFENGKDGSALKRPWGFWQSKKSALSLSLAAGRGINGSMALLVQGIGSGSLMQKISTKKSKKYYLRVRCKSTSDSTSTVTFTVWWRNDQNRWNNEALKKTVHFGKADAKGWREARIVTTAPAGSPFLVMLVGISNHDSADKVYVDNAEIYCISE